MKQIIIKGKLKTMKKINEETGCYITLAIYLIIFIAGTLYTQEFLIGGLLTLMCFLIHALCWLIYSMTPYGKKKLDESISKTLEQIPFTHVSGLSKIQENTPVGVKVLSNSCIITDLSSNVTESIELKNIVKAQPISESVLTEKDKSVIARALIGGIVFGVAGAIVGGMSGLGTKKEKTINNFFKITLNDSREILLVPFMNSENPSNLLLQRLKENIDV